MQKFNSGYVFEGALIKKKINFLKNDALGISTA